MFEQFVVGMSSLKTRGLRHIWWGGPLVVLVLKRTTSHNSQQYEDSGKYATIELFRTLHSVY